eukprot:TRINITY_DN9164_c0_g1_i5.p1 TRINITY_DN9164_c0_g1~~TRINITY_DN9164_c0_g1_i5.p1  ORF type:complete len:144 (+),score=8.41 TRINITY_DN9164_c0_g1_i5:401-832(+)
MLCQDAWHHLIDRLNNLEEAVFWQVLQSELALASVTRVRLAQNSMSIARDDLAGLQRLPCEVGDGILRHLLALRGELLVQSLNPAKYFLVGEAVERSRQGVQTTGVGQVRIRQRGAHEVRCVRGGIASCMRALPGQGCNCCPM